jgi:hypothetical protein
LIAFVDDVYATFLSSFVFAYNVNNPSS